MNARSVIAQAFARSVLARVQAQAARLGADLPAVTCEGLLTLFERLWDQTLDGDSCIALDRRQRAWLALPACAPVLAAHGPLCLDLDSLYLRRFHAAESRLAQACRARLDVVSGALPRLAPGQVLRGLHEAQSRAVQAGLQHPLALIHGGPGTGKTRTVASLIAAWVLSDPRPVKVAAPTARAGARLMESLASALSGMALPPEARAALPQAAFTVQRLLRQLPRGPGTRAALVASAGDAPPMVVLDDDAPGLVIVDEASMLSLELADALLARLPAQTALVLVGDPDQLKSVESGAVFAALCQASHPALAQARVGLSRNFRQAGQAGLVELAESVLAGTPSRSALSAAVALKPRQLRSLVEAATQRYLAMRERGLAACPAGSTASERALALLRESGAYRLVSARASGASGAQALAAAILGRLQQSLGAVPWFEGRLITITRNDEASGLFNGDTGVYVRVDPMRPSDAASAAGDEAADPSMGLEGWVAFDRPEGPLLMPVAALPEYRDAYCMSVHQAQGSEFDTVDFVAAPAEHALATRELLYTAVTRARTALVIHGDWADIEWAATHAGQRLTHLAARIDQSVDKI